MSVSWLRRVASTAAAVLAVTSGICSPPAFAAPQRDQLVAFGDSVVADPMPVSVFANSWTDASPDFFENGLAGCAVSPRSFPAIAGERMGMDVDNYACAGALNVGPGNFVKDQVTRAINEGVLTPETDRIVITTGFNDTYQAFFAEKPYHVLKAQHTAIMVEQINRMKAAAPNARIQIVGYPQVTDHGHVCIFHLARGVHERTYLPVIGDFANWAQDMQITAARQTGVEFIDVKPATQGRDLCAPPEKRVISGLIDLTGTYHRMPLHYNTIGHNLIANLIVNS